MSRVALNVDLPPSARFVPAWGVCVLHMSDAADLSIDHDGGIVTIHSEVVQIEQEAYV